MLQHLRLSVLSVAVLAGLIAAVAPVVAEPAPRAGRPSLSTARPPAPAMPMKVVIVRSGSPGCEPDCPEWIAAQGMIDEATLPQFKKVLKALGERKLPVLVDSGGGVVDDSMEIGRLIRAKGLDVVVAKTQVVPCAQPAQDCKSGRAASPVRGTVETRFSKCASSCAFLLAGGVGRYVSATSFVGVHQLKTLRTVAQIQQKFRIERKLVQGVPTETKRTLIAERVIDQKTTEARTPESAYRKVAVFFADMGIGDEIMPMLKAAPNSSIHWLTRAELHDTHMATGVEFPKAAGTAKAVVPPVSNAGTEVTAAQSSKPPATGQARPIQGQPVR